MWESTRAKARRASFAIALRSAICDRCQGRQLLRPAAGAGEAAIAISREHHDEDPVVELFGDVRDKIFNVREVDRLTSADIVLDLHGLEDAMWSEWRGTRGDQQAHKLSQGELSKLLRPFRITPKSIWPLGRRPGAKSSKGYHRQQFAAAWHSYLDGEDGTSAQPNNIKKLRSM